MKPLAHGLMLIASRRWSRASEARIGLEILSRICCQLDHLHLRLAELAAGLWEGRMGLERLQEHTLDWA